MPLKIRLDEDVNPLLAQDLRERGYGVRAASETGSLGLSDREQLERAREGGRVFLAHNRDDFLALAKEYADRGIVHAGILYTPQVPYGVLLKRVVRFLSQADERRVQNVFVWIP